MRQASAIIVFILLNMPLSFSQVRDTSLYGGELYEAVISDLFKKQKSVPTVHLTSLQVKSAPALFGETDVLKVIQLIPGVQGGKEGDVGIRIRGGNVDQSMITMDGAVLYNPSHFKGFVSIFNADITSNIKVYKGGFPAWLGTRLAGYVEVDTRIADMEKYHAGVSVGMLSSKAYFEGPVIKNKLSVIASARKSYIDLIIMPIYRKILKVEDAPLAQFSGNEFYDAQARIDWNINDKDKLRANFFIGDDKNNLSNDVNKSEFSNYMQYGNIASSLSWNRRASKKLFAGLSVGYSRYRGIHNSQFTDNSVEPAITSSSFSRSLIQEGYAKGTVTVMFSPKHTLVAGADYSFQALTPGASSEKTNEMATIDIYKGYLHTASLYADDEITPLKWLTVGIGIRGGLYAINGKCYPTIEPRPRIQLRAGRRFAFDLSYTITSQAIHQLTSSSVANPSDIWIPTTENYRPMTASQYSIGASFIPIDSSGVSISVEGYYKTMNNLLDYKDGIRLISASQWENTVCQGKGWSYGVEASISKSIGKITGQLGYTWSKSFRQFDLINNGEAFYAANDHRHNISLFLGWNISKNWNISVNWNYHTGDWITLMNITTEAGLFEEMAYQRIKGRGYWLGPMFEVITRLPEYDRKNNYQLDDYHRLDLSVNYRVLHKIGISTINLSIYNVYNRQNPYYIYPTNNGAKELFAKVCILPLLPSISYAYNF